MPRMSAEMVYENRKLPSGDWRLKSEEWDSGGQIENDRRDQRRGIRGVGMMNDE